YPDRFELIETPNSWEVFPTVKMIENHGKIFVADQQYFVTGGNNVGNWQLSREELDNVDNEGTAGLGLLFDIDIAGKGEVAKKLKEQFDELWVKWKDKAGAEKNDALDSGHDLSESEITKLPIFDDFNNQKLLEGDCKIYNGDSSQGENNLCENEYLKMIRK